MAEGPQDSQPSKPTITTEVRAYARGTSVALRVLCIVMAMVYTVAMVRLFAEVADRVSKQQHTDIFPILLLVMMLTVFTAANVHGATMRDGDKAHTQRLVALLAPPCLTLALTAISTLMLVFLPSILR